MMAVKNGKEWSARAVQECINRGLDENQFIEVYGFTGMEDLRKNLKKLYKYGYKSILAEIKKNRKKPYNNKKKKNVDIPQAMESAVQVPEKDTVAVIQNTQIPVVENLPVDSQDLPQVENLVVSKSSETEVVVEKKDEDMNSIEQVPKSDQREENIENKEDMYSVESLKVEIANTKNQLEDLKKAREALTQTNSEASQKLQNVNNQLTQMEDEILKLKAIAIESFEVMMDTSKKLEENSNCTKVQKEKLSQLELELRKLQTTTICCSADENLGKFDYYVDTVDVDSSEIQRKLSEIMMSDFGELIEEFSLKQVKQLAKILLVYETVKEGTDSKVQLVFKERNDLTVAIELMTGTHVKIIPN